MNEKNLLRMKMYKLILLFKFQIICKKKFGKKIFNFCKLVCFTTLIIITLLETLYAYMNFLKYIFFLFFFFFDIKAIFSYVFYYK